MCSATNKHAYKKHLYSGPRKSRKKVLASLRQLTGNMSISGRMEAWRKEEFEKRKMKQNEQPRTIVSHAQENATLHQTTIYTYSRRIPTVRYDDAMSSAIAGASESFLEPAAYPECIDTVCPKPEPIEDIEGYQLMVERTQTDYLSDISGYRIVDFKHVIQWAFEMEKHRQYCEWSQIQFVCEKQHGFHSVFTFKCTMCDETWNQTTEKDEKANTAFVWATVTAGSNHTQAAHITSLMDIPTMTGKTFLAYEKQLGNVWSEHLTEDIKKAGEEEKSIAIEKGNVCSDGVPYVTVYIDGGWSKRSYGHNFDSSSGMACIIGKETKKCLFLGVRNKYCYTCHYYERNGLNPKAHGCCKFFSGPSTATDSDIIVEGFLQSEEMHQLRYLHFIGDGDSSVFANLKEKVPYGNVIKKIESKKHVIKNYTTALYKIVANTKLPLYGRIILKRKLLNLTLTARKIIIHNSNECSSMAEDLRNGPLHVFGQHEKCKEYYCSVKNSSPDENNHSENQVEILKNTAPEIWALIYAANKRIAMKAGRLSNETTNVAENFMRVINKFNCGKRFSLGKGGSCQRRVHIAGLSHSSFLHKQTTQRPGQHLKKKNLVREKRRLRRQKLSRKRQTGAPVNIDFVELKRQCQERLIEFQVDSQKIAHIESATVGQYDNEMYLIYSADRLTASQFGMVCKRRNSTPCHNHVKEILYKKTICTKDMMFFGQQEQSVAMSMFMQQYNKTVRPSGLFIDEEFGFLAASPDGIIDNESAVIEIKRFPSLARKSIIIAASKNRNFPIHLENGVLIMNKNHPFYYQVQGQLRVTKMKKCYFICFLTVTQPLTVIEVDRDEEFISNMMPKLLEFFRNCVLPEIILRQVKKNEKCLDIKNFEEDRALTTEVKQEEI